MGRQPESVHCVYGGVRAEFAGFINAINPKVDLDVPIYRFNWYFGITVGAVVYGVLCKYVWPLPSESLVDEAVYPDETFFVDDESMSTGGGDVEKVGGGGTKVGGAGSDGSLDGIEVDIVLAKGTRRCRFLRRSDSCCVSSSNQCLLSTMLHTSHTLSE